MSADFETALDASLARLSSGESPDACLSAYPALADELRPLLAMAGALRAAPAPRARPEAVAEGREKVMAAFAAQRPPQTVSRGSGQSFGERLTGAFGLGPIAISKPALRFALGTLIALGLGTASAVAASSGSIPGDALYPVKQSVESLRVALTVDHQSRQALQTQFDGRRLLEVQALLQLHRQAVVEFEDVLQAIGNNGWWTIGPFAVRVTDSTVVVGEPTPGGRVRVQVRVVGDGTLAALQVIEETGQGHGPEHRSGADGLRFESPLPAGAPTPPLGHEQLPEPTHADGPEDHPDRLLAPTPGARDDWLSTPEPARTVLPTVAPYEASTAESEHHSETKAIPQQAGPTAAPAHHADPSMQPSRQPAATAQPPHQPMPTSEASHRDPAPVPAEPRQGDSAPGGGGHDSSRRH